MDLNTKKVTHEDFELYYEVYGSGKTAILCHHGNGRTAEDFKFLQKDTRKIISIHLFLHKYSTFSPSRIEPGNIYIKDVQKLLLKILKKENVDEFHWVAYSQGGRFALSMLPQMAGRVRSLFLISPDGLNDKNFYSWAQRQWWTRKLFRRWIKRPKELMKIARFLSRVRIISPKIVTFLEFYTSDKERFERAYKTFVGFRNLRPSNSEIKEALSQYPIHFKIIVGKYDKIISSESAEKFLKKIGHSEALKLIPYGHDVFKPHIEEKLYFIMNFEEI